MSFVKKLKEHKVFQTLALYLGSGWVIIEALAFLANKYGWPQNVIDVIILSVFFGLPIVLVYTWFHGTHENRKIGKIEIGLYLLIIIASIPFIFNSITGENQSLPEQELVDSSDPSIAILPMNILSEDKSNQYFADGITEAIRDHLGKIGTLKVTSRNSVEQYRETTKSSPQIAREIGVKHILTGSFQKYDDKIRVNVQLIDAVSDKQIWTEVFDRLYNDVLALQSDIALKIASQLNLRLSSQIEERINRKSTDNIDAYNFYLKGQHTIKTAKGLDIELKTAIDYYQQAIDLEPNFALAYAGMANAYVYQTYWGRTASKDIIPLATSTVMKAMEIDNEIGECYEVLGMISYFKLDFTQAEKYFKRAIELSPNFADSYFWLSNTFNIMGNLNQSLAFMDKATELDPVSTFYPINKAYILTSNREFELAENLLLDVLKNNNDSHALWALGNNYANRGKYDMAIETLQKRPDGSKNNWILGYCYGKTGQLDKAYEVIDYLLEKNKESYVPPYMIGIVYMGVGKTEEALDWFEKGLAEGPIFSYITEVRGRTKLSELEDNPRFKEILKKFGIER